MNIERENTEWVELENIKWAEHLVRKYEVLYETGQILKSKRRFYEWAKAYLMVHVLTKD